METSVQVAQSVEVTEIESWDIQFEEETETFQMELEESDNFFSLGFEEGIFAGSEPYKGEYEVTPKIEVQTLETAKKSMERDVTVLAIPYYEVDNESNGQTIVIGGN